MILIIHKRWYHNNKIIVITAWFVIQSKGLVSIDRSEAAALLSTTPRLRTRSSTNDFAPLRCMGWVYLRPDRPADPSRLTAVSLWHTCTKLYVLESYLASALRLTWIFYRYRQIKISPPPIRHKKHMYFQLALSSYLPNNQTKNPQHQTFPINLIAISRFAW